MDDLQLVIFDSDGVLVDSEAIANRVLAQTFTEIGLPTTPEEALTLYKGRILRDVTARAEERNGGPLPEGWIEKFEAARAQAFILEMKAVPGSAEAVKGVKAAGVDVCVATQGKPEKTKLTLGITGLRELFDDDAVFTAYEVERGKPFPDLFLHAAKSRGVDPAHCAVIEDTTLGVQAAVAAGMRVFGYSAETPAAALREAGATPFASMLEVPKLLGLAKQSWFPA
jgi:HAD superfamily hydrolase (TIGR01509 family)